MRSLKIEITAIIKNQQFSQSSDIKKELKLFTNAGYVITNHTVEEIQSTRFYAIHKFQAI